MARASARHILVKTEEACVDLKTKIEGGAQNSHESDKYGAFTGQINSKMLKKCWSTICYIGSLRE